MLISEQEPQVLSKRLLSSLLLSVFVSLAIFYFMSQLISGGDQLKPSSDKENYIEFVRIKRNSNTEIRRRTLPEKPKVEQKKMPLKSLSISKKSAAPKRPSMKFNTPPMDIALANGPGGIGVSGAGSMAGGSGSQLTPLVRITPNYPRQAAMQGIEGFVIVQFDVLPNGSTSNVRILKSNPRNVFDMAAKKAVLRWKYRPQVEDGKPVTVKAQKTNLPFRLE
jgi:protein TonB